MRQSGRNLPEFQEVHKEHDFLEVSRTPEVTYKVTMQPLRRFDLDSSIIFSGIMVIPQPLGMTIEMRPGVVFQIKETRFISRAVLRNICKRNNLSVAGTKVQLIRRLIKKQVPLWSLPYEVKPTVEATYKIVLPISVNEINAEANFPDGRKSNNGVTSFDIDIRNPQSVENVAELNLSEVRNSSNAATEFGVDVSKN